MPINIKNEIDADSTDSASNIIKSINNFLFNNTGKPISLPPGTVIAAANIIVTIRAHVCVCVYMYMYLYMYKNTLYWLLNY